MTVLLLFNLTCLKLCLREVNTEVTKFDDSLKKLAEEMLMVMYASDGIGLAAPQVSSYVLYVDTFLRASFFTFALHTPTSGRHQSTANGI